MSEDDKNRGVAVVVDHHHQQHHHHHHDEPPPPPPQYGTFQGVANYPPPAIGFPQPVPPPGAGAHGSSAPPPQYYTQGYQTVPGYAVAEGRPARERRLPCCGIGLGWCLFIIGFFLGAIPWYIGLFVLMCGRIDHREKPGYIACTIAAVLATVAIIIGATKGADEW
ncbi:60S ribosomal protein L18a-like protein [Tripterygium wilfordii]|uniref:60S ribosomal protein L18a-like protein n=1 Tax=Tripterygium wilfordii TaxID=458696 RepID=UPI0018F7F1D0|nr:60S ribosomal protein L18a-like protein [Tripterygium wilfordii]